MTIQDKIIALNKSISVHRGDCDVKKEIRDLLQKAAYLAPINEYAANRQLELAYQKAGV